MNVKKILTPVTSIPVMELSTLLPSIKKDALVSIFVKALTSVTSSKAVEEMSRFIREEARLTKEFWKWWDTRKHL